MTTPPINSFVKDPDSVEWFGVDWTDRLAGELPLVAADTISTSSWTIPAGLTSVATMKTSAATGVKLSGGTLGEKYTLVNEIVTATNGETLQATIYVHIKHE